METNPRRYLVRMFIFLLGVALLPRFWPRRYKPPLWEIQH